MLRVKGINSQYEYQRKLYEGQYAKIYEGMDILKNKKVALKVLTMDLEDSNRFDCMKKIAQMLMEKGPFKHIVEIFDIIENCQNGENEIIIVMEQALGNLEDYLKDQENEFLDEQLRFCLSFQIIFGTYEIHQLELMHRNIKPDNILYFRGQNDNIILKISGFGEARQNYGSNNKTHSVGEHFFQAPEMKTDNFNYNQKVEVSSVGLILYEIHTFEKLKLGNEKQIIEEDINQKFQLINVSQQMQHLLQIMIIEGPENCSTIKQTLKTAYEILQQYYYDTNYYGLNAQNALKYLLEDINGEIDNINENLSQCEKQNINLQIDFDLQNCENSQEQTLCQIIQEPLNGGILVNSEIQKNQSQNENQLIQNNLHQVEEQNKGLFNWFNYVESQLLKDQKDKVNSQDSGQYLQKGYSLHEMQMKNSTIKCNNKTIISKSKISGYYNKKGQQINKLEWYDNAIVRFDQTIQENSKTSLDYYIKGNMLYNKQKYNDAIKCYEQAISINAKDSNYYYHKGKSLSNLNQHEDAIASYDQAISINPKSSVYYSNKGNSLSNLNQYEDAIASYDQAISLNPKSSNNYNNKGCSLSNLNQHKDAIASYDQAISINPKSSVYYYNKGISLSGLNQHEDAIVCYDQAISLNPKDSNYYNNKSTILEQLTIGKSLNYLQRYEDAILCFDEIINLDLKSEQSYFQKGMISEATQAEYLLSLGRQFEAMMIYDQVNCFNTRSLFEYLKEKSQGLMGNNEKQKAILFLNKAIEIKPDHEQSYLWKSICLYDLKHYNEAISCLDKILNINFENKEAQYQKARCLYRQDCYEEAISCYDWLIRLDPYNSQYYSKKGKHINKNIILGNCLIKFFLFDEAILCYNKAIYIDKENAKYYLKKGIALKDNGIYKEAYRCFQLAQQLLNNEHQEFIDQIKQQIGKVLH